MTDRDIVAFSDNFHRPSDWSINRENFSITRGDRASPIGGSRVTHGSTNGHHSRIDLGHGNNLSSPWRSDFLLLSLFYLYSRAREIISRYLNYPSRCVFFLLRIKRLRRIARRTFDIAAVLRKNGCLRFCCRSNVS